MAPKKESPHVLCMEHSGMLQKIDNIEEKVSEIPSLKDAVNKLTTIVEVLTREKPQECASPPKTYSFWDTKAGEKIPLFATILAGITIAALTGERLIEVFKVLPLK